APPPSRRGRWVVVQWPAARTRVLDDMLAAWIAALRGDGFPEQQITRRVRRGEPLRRAPLLIVPCLDAEAAHRYPDDRRNAAEREMVVGALGAARQKLLVALAVEGPGSRRVARAVFFRPGATNARPPPH